MKLSLKNNYMVIGYVKLGANIDALISTAKKDIGNLNKNDNRILGRHK
jgi:hypothetical protein